MSEFVRLPNLVINLEWLLYVEFEKDLIRLHFPLGQKRMLRGEDATAFLDLLKQRHNIDVSPAA